MKRRTFPGYGPEVEARYTRAGQWLRATIYGNDDAKKWCAENGVPIRKAATEGIGSAGGFLVPAELSRAIMDIRDQYGAFRRRARLIPMAHDSMSVPRHPGGAGAYFMAEGAGATETGVSLDAINLTAKKIGSVVRISSEMDEDGIVDVVDFIANELAFAFASKEDDCAFNGDGASAYGKMRGLSSLVLDGNHNAAKVSAASNHKTFLTLDSTDVGNLVSAVRAAAIPNAAWFCSQTCFAQTFIRLAGGTGYLPMQEADGIMTPHYLGFPVILTQKLPLGAGADLSGKVMLAFGDMYLAGALGERRGIILAKSPERYMDQDQIAILATERFHTVVHDIGDNSNYGAVAALVGTA